MLIILLIILITKITTLQKAFLIQKILLLIINSF